MKTLVIILVTLVTIAGFRYVGSLIYRDYQLNNPETSTTEYTKEQYLAKVKENGGTDAEVCAYTKLIDQYGTKETLKMDLRVVADENDVDKRIYTALQECL